MAPDADFLRPVACPALQAAYRYSAHHLQRLACLCEDRAEQLSAIEVVALGGSLGRLEASVDSDLDCIIVLRDEVAPAQGEAQLAFVHDLLRQTPFKAPKAAGIYRQGVRRAALLDRASLGSLDESPQIFGKRMQLLLDARPVFGAAQLKALQSDILVWYGSDFLTSSPSRGWTYLCNDVMRYLHSYAAWQQFKFERSADDSWQLRQAKFRTSRVLTFAAMMFLLGQSDRYPHKLSWLHSRLCLTPMQRIHAIMADYDPAAYGQLLLAYESCFAALADPAVRAQLVATGPNSEGRMEVAYDDAYERIRQSSAAIVRALTEFALARRDDWGARFFAHWLL